MQLPPLPSAFSKQAKKNVVDAEIKARRSLDTPVFNRLFPGDPPDGTRQVLEYALKVFAAFGHEACMMANGANPWTSDQIMDNSRAFLEKLIYAVQVDYGGHSDYRLRELTDSRTGTILQNIRLWLQGSDEFRAFENELLKAENNKPEAGVQDQG